MLLTIIHPYLPPPYFGIGSATGGQRFRSFLGFRRFLILFFQPISSLSLPATSSSTVFVLATDPWVYQEAALLDRSTRQY